MSFRLDHARNLVIEDEGAPGEIKWTPAEAKEAQLRHETHARDYERSYDAAIREGRTITADTAKAMVSYHAGKALELFRVLQSVTQREIAA